jgi:acyl-CoA thioester hydrolase
MSRIRIDLPETFSFTTFISIRISDINYGGHVGNDNVLSIIHEARVQFLQKAGYNELNAAGTGLIMSDVGIEFKNEIFYGEALQVSVTTGEFSKVGFDIYYKLEKNNEGKKIVAVKAKTGMVCYDYKIKKIVAVPGELKEKLSS